MGQSKAGIELFKQTLNETTGAVGTGVLDVSQYKHLRVEVKVLAVNNGGHIAALISDVAMGDPSANYTSGTPSGYMKSRDGEAFFVSNIGIGVQGGNSGVNNGNSVCLNVRPEYLAVQLGIADGATTFSAILRVVGFPDHSGPYY